ncbi:MULTISPECIES: amino acid ABC transporter permease [Herbaspirillum]|uniref:amino acid ABC transporter permease n=1 Tax=Herbaspirillum TaxID=963 RepID=UPI00067C5625|nr:MULTISPECIES: amino acid ABC transporter permease [Herbaspirillum]MBB5391843.1 polar amino acid transport system permease protein [Herbaspirillum sp. SJZ102]TQK13302.1 amino acid ABC transporter membrane protein 1 (PAAT family) [Herbaspirillum sp. SJZ130]TQK15306.1 amino acid ABC transporter membrane protein 1 (PAAT family) [Herbaspirillum sp. SJZ106]
MEQFVFTFFNAEIAGRYWQDILRGMGVTVLLSLAVIAAGLLLGLLLAVLRATGQRAATLAVVAFADIMRSLPPLIVIIVLFFAFPYIDLAMSSFTATWLALTLVLAAYAEESIWAGILALPRGQSEAARSTGLSWIQAMAWVVLPQALRMAVPPLTNRVISITKNTALGSVVALSEILNTAQAASSNAGNPTPLMLGAAAYLVIFIPVVLFARWLETRWRWKR